MAKKIVVTNAKGGVGKSTTSLNLADALRFVGFRVLLVDLDPSRNATSVYTKKREDIKTLKNLLEGEKAKNCIYKADFGDIIPGDKYLARERSELYRACTDDPAFIKKALKSVEKDYDYIIFDTPPTINTWMISAIYAADGAVCPVLPAKFALDGLSELLESLNDLEKEMKHKLPIYGILLTGFDMRNSQDNTIKDMLPTLGSALGVNVFETSISKCQEVEKCITANKSLFEAKPNSKAAVDYVNWVKELLEIMEG